MSLAARSLLVLALLFGLVFAIGAAVLWYYDAPVWFAVVFAAAVVGVQYLLGPTIISWVFKIDWVAPETVSPVFGAWLRDTCARQRMPVPAFGIIRDGRPNAFTFGHYPGDARVVVTQGLLEMLPPEQVHAVVAHELGHVRNWDFVVMTVASAIPLILYVLYTFSRSREGRNASAAGLVGIGAYVAYIASQYIVLLLSRVREYYADYQSARTTQDPNALTSALVTIAYGLARATVPQGEEADGKKPRKGMDWVAAAAPLGIASAKLAPAFAACATDATGNFSMANMRQAMRWELVNPWARLFELASTHPLTARRIQHLQRLCRFSNEAPRFDLEQAPEPGAMERFATDLLFVVLPFVGVAVGLAMAAGRLRWGLGYAGYSLLGWPLLLGGVAWLARLLFEYRSGFAPSDVVTLLGRVDVSHVRGAPAQLHGRIIGRGVPGLFYSEDLVLQDENGFILLDYRQPFGFLEFLFGLLKAERFIGREVTVRGWYRRAPMPFIEVKEMDFGAQQVRCYHYPAKYLGAMLCIAAGVALMAISL